MTRPPTQLRLRGCVENQQASRESKQLSLREGDDMELRLARRWDITMMGVIMPGGEMTSFRAKLLLKILK